MTDTRLPITPRLMDGYFHYSTPARQAVGRANIGPTFTSNSARPAGRLEGATQ